MKSFQPSYKNEAHFNIHTHPGTRDGYGGNYEASDKDWERLNEHPYKAHYILSRKFGLVKYGLESKDSYRPSISKTPMSIRKFIHNNL